MPDTPWWRNPEKLARFTADIRILKATVQQIRRDGLRDVDLDRIEKYVDDLTQFVPQRRRR